MIDPTPPDTSAPGNSATLDELLRDTLPDIKLALGELIDRENSRQLPGRYARLLPDTLLAVTLRPDAADAMAPVAAAVEHELTDSSTRHGSLYDRGYRVELRRVDDPDAPLFSVSAHAGQPPAPPAPAPPAAAVAGTANASRPAAPTLPAVDPDATRLDGYGPAGWEPGRWLLVVQDELGEELEAFRLSEPLTTLGRRSEDPGLQTTVMLRDVPHVSRRQLALVWEEREGRPGFRVYNLGQPPLMAGEHEVPGARIGRGPLRLDQVSPEHTTWISPGTAITIGETGPVLRIEEIPAAEEDPDATRFG
jgi:hypothetical protein